MILSALVMTGGSGVTRPLPTVTLPRPGRGADVPPAATTTPPAAQPGSFERCLARAAPPVATTTEPPPVADLPAAVTTATAAPAPATLPSVAADSAAPATPPAGAAEADSPVEGAAPRPVPRQARVAPAAALECDIEIPGLTRRATPSGEGAAPPSAAPVLSDREAPPLVAGDPDAARNAAVLASLPGLPQPPATPVSDPTAAVVAGAIRRDPPADLPGVARPARPGVTAPADAATLAKSPALATAAAGAGGRELAVDSTADAAFATVASVVADSAAPGAAPPAPVNPDPVAAALGLALPADAATRAASATGAAMTPSPVPLSTPPPPVALDHADWPQQMGEHIQWHLGEGVQEARIEVTPGDLGPVQVHLSMEDSGLRVHLSASHAQTRELLQGELPRLCEGLQQAGVTVAQAGVDSGQGRTAQTRTAWPQGSGRRGAAEPEAGRPPLRVLRRRGLLDDYA